MIKVTNALKEDIDFTEPVTTVREALHALNRQYDNNLSQYVDENAGIILEKDGNPGVLVDRDDLLDTELGDTNVITFFYPFKGG